MTQPRLHHEALFYRTDDEYADGTAGFVEAGLALGEPVLVSVPVAKHDVLRARLGDRAGQIQLADMAQVGHNPAWIIPFVRRFAESCGDRRVRFVGEPIWPGRTDAQVRECTRHEALLNAAFGDAAMSILCPYDAAALAPAVLADAGRTHPILVAGTTRWNSDGYGDPAEIYGGSRHPLPPPPAGTAAVPFADVPAVRLLVQEAAATLPAEVAEDLVVAVHEIVTNTLRHGGGSGTLRVWREPGTLVCEVSDAGRITDPLAGRRVPDPAAPGGRGLWLANQLCDLVEIHSGDSGTTIRLHSRRTP